MMTTSRNHDLANLSPVTCKISYLENNDYDFILLDETDAIVSESAILINKKLKLYGLFDLK